MIQSESMNFSFTFKTEKGDMFNFVIPAQSRVEALKKLREILAQFINEINQELI